MNDLLSYFVLFIVGIIAGAINVTAGGGSSITLPALIFLGLDPALANGTLRIAIISQNVSAALSFHKEDFKADRETLKYSLLTIPGSILGAFFAVKISDVWFERILGVVMIGVIITILFPRMLRDRDRSGTMHTWFIYPSLLAIGFYGGFIQVGVGFLIIAALHHMLGIDLVRTNMNKVIITLVYTLPVFLIFLLSGNVHWGLGICLAGGTATGGWWAAKLSVRKGEKFIKYFLVVAIFIIALKLLGVF